MRGKRVDANTKQIVDAFANCGAKVRDYSQYGNCGHDKIVLFRDDVYIVEIKDGAKCPSSRRLTDKELNAKEFYGPRFHVVESVDDVLKMLGINRP